MYWLFPFLFILALTPTADPAPVASTSRGNRRVSIAAPVRTTYLNISVGKTFRIFYVIFTVLIAFKICVFIDSFQGLFNSCLTLHSNIFRIAIRL